MINNRAEAVKLLLKKQANPALRNHYDLNPHRLATTRNYTDIAALLPSSKSLALRRIRTAGKLRAAMRGGSSLTNLMAKVKG